MKIKGEAYFDVAHNEKSPFKVIVKGQTIEDIGTTFNINSYDDEPNIRTTLITGSARVITDNGKSVVIKPNQMATIINSDQISVAQVNAQNAVDWKNGVFLFDKEPLESVMRKIARWYDVDIVYSGNEKIEEVFGGSITRYASVSQVLRVLEVTGDVHFKIEGRKIIVSKK
ncbi:FecR protein [compost metagenome]